MTEEVEWQIKGRCSNTQRYNPDWWSSEKPSEIQQAKWVCTVCPVLNTCADWALKHREIHGVWGGMSVDERDSLLQNRPIKRVYRRKTA